MEVGEQDGIKVIVGIPGVEVSPAERFTTIHKDGILFKAIKKRGMVSLLIRPAISYPKAMHEVAWS
jgi:hypothetical protein